MKSLNKKGFILVETLIVTVFVVTMFILIYQATLPILGDFEQYNRFEDINIIYDANLYKQMLSKYGNFTYINNEFEKKDINGNSIAYLDISNCDETNIYKSPDYCHLVQQAINIKENDRIILTDYDIRKFKIETNNNDMFDSGVFSNFKTYLDTLSNIENFYVADNGKVGKYRLFLIKNTINSDGSKSRKYTNLGIYEGENKKYIVGETVYVDINGTNEKFYVLKNSDSIDKNVTLIYSKNLENSNVSFSTENTPGSLINLLSTKTFNWPSETLFNYQYYSRLDKEKYSFNFNGLKARLLDEYDIYEVTRCKEYKTACFDPDNAFDILFDNNELGFLTDNLDENEGYWTAVKIPNTESAWTIQKGEIKSEPMDATNIGIRPIITIEKQFVERGE